jgi:hypothetical protein
MEAEMQLCLPDKAHGPSQAPIQPHCANCQRSWHHAWGFFGSYPPRAVNSPIPAPAPASDMPAMA